MIDHMAAGQLRAYVLHRNPHLNHQHQNMVSKIGNFIDGLGSVTGFPGNDDLRAFLAHLLENLVDAFLEQISGVGAFREFRLAAQQQRVQPLQ